jgi:hypothetical protein
LDPPRLASAAGGAGFEEQAECSHDLLACGREDGGVRCDRGAEGVTDAAPGGDVVDETVYPPLQGLVGGPCVEEIGSRRTQGVDLVLVGRDDERVSVREVAVQRANADAGAGRDRFQGNVFVLRGEGLPSRR